MTKSAQNKTSVKPHLYLKEWMDHLSVSDDQMAGRIGVASRTTVWKLYTEQHRLDLSKIYQFAEALGINASQLNYPPGTPSLDAIVEDATPEQRAMAVDVIRRMLGKVS